MPCTIGGFNDGEHRIESTCRHIYDFGGDAMDELLLALLRRQAVPGPPNSSNSSGSWHSKSSGALAAALRRACCHLHFDGDATRDSVRPLAPTVSGSSGAAAAARAQGAQRVEAALGSFAHLPPLALFARREDATEELGPRVEAQELGKIVEQQGRGREGGGAAGAQRSRGGQRSAGEEEHKKTRQRWW